MRLIHLKEGLRMFKRARAVKKRGFLKYQGSPEQVAVQIINACWNKEHSYFQVSAGHFTEFWCRDFGMCAEALVKLGYRSQVIQTLDYALAKFQQNKRITTTISPDGVCFDFPYYAADSLPFIIRTIRVAQATDLQEKYKDFLKSEVQYYFDNVFDKERSMVRRDKFFSEMQDFAKRPSSCYANCMLSMLADDVLYLGMDNPFIEYKIKDSVMGAFWNGSFFYEDSSGGNIVSGDANTFPFWCGVTDSPDAYKKVIISLEQAGLTKPFPLKYDADRNVKHQMHFTDLFAGDYERDSVWIHLGLCFLDVVRKFDPQRFENYLDQYTSLIEKHQNFLEVYDRDGNPLHNFFYYADESMSWVSKWLYFFKN